MDATTSDRVSAAAGERAPVPVPAGSNWRRYMSPVGYYGVPIFYVAMITALFLLGSGWMQRVVSVTGWLLHYVGMSYDPAEVAMRTVAAFALLSIFISTLRLAAAIKIPPEATLGQNIDRFIPIIPILTMVVFATWGVAKGWTFDPVAKKCLFIAFWTILLQDIWIAGLAQKQVAAYRRRLDIV